MALKVKSIIEETIAQSTQLLTNEHTDDHTVDGPTRPNRLAANERYEKCSVVVVPSSRTIATCFADIPRLAAALLVAVVVLDSVEEETAFGAPGTRRATTRGG